MAELLRSVVICFQRRVTTGSSNRKIAQRQHTVDHGRSYGYENRQLEYPFEAANLSAIIFVTHYLTHHHLLGNKHGISCRDLLLRSG